MLLEHFLHTSLVKSKANSIKFRHVVRLFCATPIFLFLVIHLQYAPTSLIMDFSIRCVDFLRYLREQRSFLRACCYSHGDGGGGGSFAVLLFSTTSTGI